LEKPTPENTGKGAEQSNQKEKVLPAVSGKKRKRMEKKKTDLRPPS